jgi:gamma-glutamylcyclotransferase (GGCT)/AIG2-like uncharacterized protein YtfP
MDRLFVYGIFLSHAMRQEYGMDNPRYATVKDYATFAATRDGTIVESARVQGLDLVLTGLVVDVNPTRWEDIDSLERGYDRIRVTTTDRQEVWMYVRKEWNV